MMPVVMMAMMMREVMTNLARAVNGVHDTAAGHGGGVIVGVGIAVIIRVIVVIDAPDEEAMAMPEPVMQSMTGKARTTGNMTDPRATPR